MTPPNASTEPKNFPWLGLGSQEVLTRRPEVLGPLHMQEAGLCRHFGAFLHGGMLQIGPYKLAFRPPCKHLKHSASVLSSDLNSTAAAAIRHPRLPRIYRSHQ
jgi:hypothetical protein